LGWGLFCLVSGSGVTFFLHYYVGLVGCGCGVC
jgi:hypothetical protein